MENKKRKVLKEIVYDSVNSSKISRKRGEHNYNLTLE